MLSHAALNSKSESNDHGGISDDKEPICVIFKPN